MTAPAYADQVRFDVLGPLRVTAPGGPVTVPGGRSAAALCWLVANANRPVSFDSLVDVLWTRAPDNAPAKVRMLVRSLVPVLGPTILLVDRQARLVVSDDAIDAGRFARLIHEAAGYLRADDLARAHVNLDEALALWRGDPYPELNRAVPTIGMIDELIELRLGAAEDLNALALRGPVDYTLVAELRSLAILHADRPRLARQLALALYRTDRQIEALDLLSLTGRELGDADGRTSGLRTAMLNHRPELASGELTDC